MLAGSPRSRSQDASAEKSPGRHRGFVHRSQWVGAYFFSSIFLGSRSPAWISKNEIPDMRRFTASLTC